MLNLTRVEVQMHPLALVHRPKVRVISSNTSFFFPENQQKSSSTFNIEITLRSASFDAAYNEIGDP